jgi:hypothetical protein
MGRACRDRSAVHLRADSDEIISAPLRSRGRTIALVASIAVRSIARGQPAASPPTVTAAAAPSAIRLDGALDEPAWQAAGLIPDLAQQSPKPGEPTPYRTEVRILVDARNVYFGITCFDPNPGAIAVHTMLRDGDMIGDDRLAIVLDTFGDGRSGYFFQINANGARVDGLISGPEELSLDWDGIWDVAARRGPNGWTAEIVVPAQTLGFRKGERRWGFNVERFVPRERTTLRWSGTTLDSLIEDVSRAGALEGVGILEQGAGWSLSPYALARFRSNRDEDHRTFGGTFGGDVSYNFTPQLFGVLTVNTDFAETEVDTRQVNLTRFPLFFPEKRAFFVEGANLFVFGLGLEERFIPFYSRRIGLFGGRLVPIDAGVKVLGRAGRFGIAVLDVEMDDSPVAPGTNLFAGRVTYDADSHLRLGAIGTRGNPDGIHDNSLAGVDAVWRTSTFAGDKNFFVGLWGAGSGGDLPDGRRTGWGIKIDYPNDLWDVSFRYNDFGDALDPRLGFLPRPGTRQYEAGGAYQPRPQGGPFGWVRQFFFEFFGTLVTDLHGETESWEVFMAPFNARTQSGEHLEANWVPQFERLDAPFEIARGIVIEPGRYRFDRYRVEAQSSDHRPWRVGTTVWFGTFFDGHLTQLVNYANWTSPSGRLVLSLDAEHDFGDLPAGRFIQRLWQWKTIYAFTTELIASAFVQYDSQSREAGLNARVRWTVKPGSDVFLVWNRNWRHPLSEGAFAASPISDQVVLKLRWTFRR